MVVVVMVVEEKVMVLMALALGFLVKFTNEK